MQTKLQELTDKLYNEGLSKGKQEGEKVLSDAKAQAQKILSEAKEKAQKTIDDANAQAEALKAKAVSDIKMASEQSLLSTKKDIENILSSAIVDKQANEALANPEVIKEVVVAVAKAFNASEAQDLNVVLPESLKKNLEGWAAKELGKELKAGVKADFSKKIAGGFTIGPADGSYFVSLTDETFKTLICEYLRPVTRKLLFGE